MKKIVAFLAALLYLALLHAPIVFGGVYDNSYMTDMQSSSSPSTTNTSNTSSRQSTRTAASDPRVSDRVTIQNFAFSPATLTVSPGTTVTWVNRDSATHTVTGDGGQGPQSGMLQTGESYSFTFSTPGTFTYHCSIHPMMKGQVTVTGPTSPAPTTPTTSQGNNSGVSATTMTPATTTSLSSSAPSYTPSTASQPATLPATGVADALGIAAIAAVLGTVVSTIYLVHRQHKFTD